MSKLCHVIVLLLPLLVSGSACGPRKPAGEIEDPKERIPPGTPIDAATVAAWKQVGFGLETVGSVEKGEVPGFKVARMIKAEDLAGLPEPAVPFYISLINARVTVPALKSVDRFKTLVTVYISNTQVTDEVLEHFAAAGFHKLSLARAADGKRPAKPEDVAELYLNLSPVTDNGLKHLAGLTNLTNLGLSASKVTDAGLGQLAGLTKLQKLDLQQTKVTDAGLGQLTGFKNLTALNLAATPVTDAGMKHLARFTNLTALDLWKTAVTDAGLEHLTGLTNLTTLSLPHGVGSIGAKHLSKLDNLATLNISDGMISDLKPLARLKRLTTLKVDLREETSLRSVASAGLLHALPQATAADGKRPTGPEDVAHLDLNNLRVSDAGLPMLVGLKNLTTLDLSQTNVRGDGLKHLTGLTGLKTLKLGSNSQGNEVTDAALEHAAAFRQLTHLRLDSTRITSAGMKHLAELTNLATLQLSVPAGAGLKPLAGLTNLTTLELSGQFADEEMVHLAGLTKIKTLKILSSSWHSVGLRNLSGLKQLVTLDMGDRLTNKALIQLADIGQLHTLAQARGAGDKRPTGPDDVTHLALGQQRFVSDDGLKALKGLKNLTTLNLSGTEVTGPGFAHLTGLTKLTSLDLSRSSATDASVEHLAKLGSLTTINIAFSSISSGGAKKLQKALPNCKIE